MGEGRTAVVTGATRGIGRATAAALAAAGVRVGLVARDVQRGEQTAREIGAAGKGELVVFPADLSRMGEVRRLATEALDAFPRLDILVNCAGIFNSTRVVTTDGLEEMFATNYLAPFLLTNLLLDRMRDGGDGRIVMISAPSTTALDFDDLQGERSFGALHAFGASKAADLMFTAELARRIAGSGANAIAVHPGLSRTNLMHQASRPLRALLWLSSAPPDRAGRKIARLVLAPGFGAMNGRFLKASGKPFKTTAYVTDPVAGRRLWDTSERLTQIE